MSSSIPGGSIKRLEWADIAKGIGIILLVTTHTPLEYKEVGIFISSFRMAFFFFLAGYFFSFGKYNGFRPFLLKKVKTLLLPYSVFAAISYLYFILRYHFGDPDYYKDLNIYQELFGIFYSAGIRKWMDFNIPLWFLTGLFTVEVMFYWIKRLAVKNAPIVYVLVGCSLIGYLDGLYNPYKLPWSVDVAFTAIVFYGMGHMLKASINKLLSRPMMVKFALVTLFIILNLIFSIQRVNINMKLLGNYYDFYLSAFCGITFLILISSLIHSNILTFVGRNSLIIMAGHMPMMNIATKVVAQFGSITNLYLYEFTRVFVTLLLLVPLIYFINTFTPFILGRSIRAKSSDKRLHAA